MLVYVQYCDGRIVWENSYSDIEEMLDDIRILSKPSMFGNSNYRIITQKQ